jgi:hypothetical protein
MKSKLLAVAFLVAMTSAASARTNWQGEVMVTAVTAQCAAGGDQVGDNYLATFQPENNATITDNSTSNFLSFFNRRAAFSIKFENLAAGAPYTAVQVSGRGNHFTGAGTVISISTAPAAVASSTQTLVINARIGNWFATPGCTATVRGAFVKRIDAP